MIAPSGDSFAYDINEYGHVAGTSWHSSGGWHAFEYNGGVMTDIGTLPVNYNNPDSEAYAINNLGQVVGWSDVGDGNGLAGVRAFSTINGVKTNLGSLGGRSYATGINDAGQITGWSQTASGPWNAPYSHAFIYSNGSMTDIGTLGGNYAGANEINALGHVVGWSKDAYGGDRAFYYDGTKMNDLGIDIGGWSNDNGAINDHDQIVISRWLYSNGVLTDINTLLPSNSGWLISGAYDINNAGAIVGQGLYNGQYHAYLMTPVVPEPINFILFVTGGILLAGRRYLRNRVQS